jgi:signal transduction histidine kinase
LAWIAAALALVVVLVALVAEASGTRAGIAADKRDWILAVLCAPLGARVVAYARRNATGWLILGVGLLGAGTIAASIPSNAPAVWLRDWLWWPTYGLLVLAALLFPDGRAVSRPWRWVVAGLTVAICVGSAAAASIALRTPVSLVTGRAVVEPGPDVVVVAAATGAMCVGALLAVIAVLVRIRRSPAATRGPLVWAAANAGLLLVAIVLDLADGASVLGAGAALAIPAATTIGVLRYGLYDIDLLVHRSLYYGLVTVAVIGAYGVAVAATTALVPQVAAPLAAAVTVVALLPLRQGIQSVLERHLYGLRSRPYELVAALSRRVGLAQTPEEIIAGAVTTIGEGLKTPFVAVHLGSGPAPAATYGQRRAWPVTTFTVSYRGQPIGRLDIQQRSPDEPWSGRERALLRQLTEQLGPSAASVSLTHALQAARERLVRAREEQLRRLQRDLHDSVGPALSGARMLIQGSRTHAANGPLMDTFARLDANLADAASEVRRIVDNLRPPALDRGLVAALRAAVSRHRSAELSVGLSVEGEMSSLPAAVEVATYRIVDEALANVAKHAGAGNAAVRIARTGDALRIHVDDDGAGLARPRPDGVGLESMRERCQELGGAFRVVQLAPGTRVAATIPVD